MNAVRGKRKWDNREALKFLMLESYDSKVLAGGKGEKEE